MRNLKKVLSVLLVVVMMATAMVPAFAAETFTYETQAKALNSVGLFYGVNADKFEPDLGSALTREQGFTLIIRLLGKSADAKALAAADVEAALATFGDAKNVEPTLKNEVALAVKLGLVKGDGKNLDAKGAMLGKDFATVLLRQLGYADTEFAYDTATATLAEKGGLSTTEATKFGTKALIRDDLVGMAYGSLQAKYKTGETVIAKLIKDGVVKEADAIAAGIIAKPANLTVTAAATGAKKITVTFNSAVDSTKATITVKKGTVAVNTDGFAFAPDNKSVVITTTTKLSKGDYTVSVAGLTDTALTATANAEDEKVVKINIVSTKAPRLLNDNTKAKVLYEVLNQYSEKMTNQTINWTISTGKTVLLEDKTTTPGSFVIENAGTPAADFIPGQVVYITGVFASSGTVVNGQVEIALASQADSVTFKGVYDTQDNKIVDLPAGFANDRYVLLFTVNDQYGNSLSTPEMEKLVFTSNNPLFVDATSFGAAADVTIDSKTYKAVKLVKGQSASNGGSVTIQAISTVTGKISTFDINASAKATVKTFSMSAPASMVAEKESVEIPFAAVDQYGNPVTKFDSLNGNITLSPAYDEGTQVGLKFEKQDDATAKLMYYAPATGATDTFDLPVYLSSVVTVGGNFSSVMISVKDLAVPTSVVGLDSDVTVSVATYNNTTVEAKYLKVQDQYGRTMKDSAFTDWLGAKNADGADINSIVITSKFETTPFAVKLNGGADTEKAVIASTADKVTISADYNSATTGKTEGITFTLASGNDGSSTLASSAVKMTFTKVGMSEFTSYEVADIGTMYNDTATVTDAAYKKTLKVYGVKADGTKVLLPAMDYSVSTDGKLSVAGNVISDTSLADAYLDNDFKTTTGEYADVKVKVLVTVNDLATGSAISILSKDLALSNKAPKIATVTFDTDKVASGKAVINPSLTNEITAANLKGVIKEVKDQYGVKHTDVAPVITITNLTKVSGSTFAVADNGTADVKVTGAKLGDKFTVEFKYAGGATATVDFTVGLAK